jgi:hypothetical protein
MSGGSGSSHAQGKRKGEMIMRTTVKSNNSNGSWQGVPQGGYHQLNPPYPPPNHYQPLYPTGPGQHQPHYLLDSSSSNGGGARGGGAQEPPNINNYTMIKEALIQHSRQKRKAMGGASVQSQKKKR